MNTTKPTVYIIQDNPFHSFFPAERFGTLRHCLAKGADRNPDVMVSVLRAALRGFVPGDYLLLSGAPLSCGAAFAILHETYDRFNVLRWSSQTQDYTVEQIDLLTNRSEAEHEESK